MAGEETAEVFGALIAEADCVHVGALAWRQGGETVLGGLFGIGQDAVLDEARGKRLLEIVPMHEACQQRAALGHIGEEAAEDGAIGIGVGDLGERSHARRQDLLPDGAGTPRLLHAEAGGGDAAQHRVDRILHKAGEALHHQRAHGIGKRADRCAAHRPDIIEDAGVGPDTRPARILSFGPGIAAQHVAHGLQVCDIGALAFIEALQRGRIAACQIITRQIITGRIIAGLRAQVGIVMPHPLEGLLHAGRAEAFGKLDIGGHGAGVAAADATGVVIQEFFDERVGNVEAAALQRALGGKGDVRREALRRPARQPVVDVIDDAIHIIGAGGRIMEFGRGAGGMIVYPAFEIAAHARASLRRASLLRAGLLRTSLFGASLFGTDLPRASPVTATGIIRLDADEADGKFIEARLELLGREMGQMLEKVAGTMGEAGLASGRSAALGRCGLRIGFGALGA